MKDVNFENVALLILGLAGICGGSYIASNYKKQQTMASLPDSYWESQKQAEIEKTARHKLDIEKEEREKALKREHELKWQKEQHEFEKNQPDSYWAFKASEQERLSKEKLAEEDRRARTEQAAEMRRAIDSLKRGIEY